MIFKRMAMGGSKSDFKTTNLCFRMEWVDKIFLYFSYFPKVFFFLEFQKIIFHDLLKERYWVSQKVILKQLIFVSEWNGRIGYFSTFHIFQKYFLFFGISEIIFFHDLLKERYWVSQKVILKQLIFVSEWNGRIGYFSTFHIFQKYF